MLNIYETIISFSIPKKSVEQTSIEQSWNESMQNFLEKDRDRVHGLPT